MFVFFSFPQKQNYINMPHLCGGIQGALLNFHSLQVFPRNTTYKVLCKEFFLFQGVKREKKNHCVTFPVLYCSCLITNICVIKQEEIGVHMCIYIYTYIHTHAPFHLPVPLTSLLPKAQEPTTSSGWPSNAHNLFIQWNAFRENSLYCVHQACSQTIETKHDFPHTAATFYRLPAASISSSKLDTACQVRHPQGNFQATVSKTYTHLIKDFSNISKYTALFTRFVAIWSTIIP